MMRQRLFVAGLLLLAVVGWRFFKPWRAFWHIDRQTWEKIHEGMSVGELERLVGSPPWSVVELDRVARRPWEMLGYKEYSWRGANGALIMICDRGDTVQQSLFAPPELAGYPGFTETAVYFLKTMIPGL
jgi:hypothetical protein